MLALRKSTILYSVGVLFLALTAQLATAQDRDPTPKGNIDAGGDKTAPTDRIRPRHPRRRRTIRASVDAVCEQRVSGQLDCRL